MDVTVIEDLPTESYFKFRPDQLYHVRKSFNLAKSERIRESIEILRKWIQKQDYFNKKDFSDDYLERLLIFNKGSVERAKSCFDKLCTFRTIWPHYFTAIDINSFLHEFKSYNTLLLPDVTEDYSRVYLLQIKKDYVLHADIVLQFIRKSIIAVEYFKRYDYPQSFTVICDARNANITDLLGILSPTQLQQIVNLFMRGYGLRVQGIHLITSSKSAGALVSLIKQVLSKKIGSRLHVHKSEETLYDYVPKKILPADYGGDAPPISEMMENYLEVLSSKEHKEYMKEIQAMTIDLSKKVKDSSTDDYIAMSGSFRTLDVD